MQRKPNLRLINNNVLWRLFDIVYESDRKDLPAEIIVDLDRLYFDKEIDKGYGNLNYKVYSAIEQITGCKSTSARVEIYNKN